MKDKILTFLFGPPWLREYNKEKMWKGFKIGLLDGLIVSLYMVFFSFFIYMLIQVII